MGALQRCVAIPLPAGAQEKPNVGSWDWVNDATYEGKSSELTGELLDIWASNSSVSEAIPVLLSATISCMKCIAHHYSVTIVFAGQIR